MKDIKSLVAGLGGPVEAAAKLNRSVQAIYSYMNDTRTFPAELCLKAERLTHGEYTCEILRPDIDWTRASSATEPA